MIAAFAELQAALEQLAREIRTIVADALERLAGRIR